MGTGNKYCPGRACNFLLILFTTMNQLFLLTIVQMSLLHHINADWGCSIQVGQSTTNEAESRMFLAPQRPILWRNGRVNFVFDNSITRVEKSAVYKAMRMIMNAVPCIKFFKQRGWNVQNALIIRKTCICGWTCNRNTDYVGGSANLGFQIGGPGYLNIESCLDEHIRKNQNNIWTGLGLLVHELLHSLGVPHTQSRSDSHNYINVHWDNIIHKKKDNYFTNRTIFDTHQVEYDCMSIMHYRDNGFQIKGAGPTMTAKDPYSCDLKSANLQLRPSDITLLKRMYNCQ